MMMNREISNLIKPQKEILLNPMQMAAVLANHRYKIPYITIEAARGSGKSTVLGWFLKEAVRQMPRSTGVGYLWDSSDHSKRPTAGIM